MVCLALARKLTALSRGTCSEPEVRGDLFIAGKQAGVAKGELLLMEAENHRLEAEVLAMQRATGRHFWGQ